MDHFHFDKTALSYGPHPQREQRLDNFMIIIALHTVAVHRTETQTLFTGPDKFLNRRMLYLCNPFSQNRANSVTDCSAVSRVNERRIRASLCPFSKFVNLTKTTNVRQTMQIRHPDIICVLCYW